MSNTELGFNTFIKRDGNSKYIAVPGDVTAEFAPEFANLKDLAEDLRDLLFPIRGKLFTGTDKDRNIQLGKLEGL
jgi:hypothetical protein